MGILLRKPMDLHRKHQAEKETARKIQERGMTQNVMADGSAPAGDAGKTYVRPGTSISQGFTP